MIHPLEQIFVQTIKNHNTFTRNINFQHSVMLAFMDDRHNLCHIAWEPHEMLVCNLLFGISNVRDLWERSGIQCTVMLIDSRVSIVRHHLSKQSNEHSIPPFCRRMDRFNIILIAHHYHLFVIIPHMATITTC